MAIQVDRKFQAFLDELTRVPIMLNTGAFRHVKHDCCVARNAFVYSH